MSADERARARKTALDLLARREHSRLELRDKLALRGYPDELIVELIDSLVASGILSETRFAESFVSARARKGQGPRRLRAELRQRGLTDALVDETLNSAQTDWSLLAAQVRSRKFGESPPGNIQERARQTRFLEYRGFTGEQIRAALSIRE